MKRFSYDDILIDYYPAKVWDTTLLGQVTLTRFLNSHKNPRPEILEVFKKIEKAAEEGNLKEKDYLKQNFLYYFTLSCSMRGKRNYDSIVSQNPIMICEFDKVEHAEELKTVLFNRLSCCIAAYLSPSKKGVKLLIRIPTPKSISEYKQYYCGISYYLSKLTGYDSANYNISLPLFLSYDHNILIRPENEVTEWTQRGEKINAFKAYDGEFEPPEDINEEDREEVIRRVTKFVDAIDCDGHTRLLSISTVLGGWVGASYISFEDAQELIHELIANNSYLQKGIKNYQKTATTLMLRGMQSPLPLNQ